MYDSIHKKQINDNQIILQFNSEIFENKNFINMPDEKCHILIENVSKKKQYKM